MKTRVGISSAFSRLSIEALFKSLGAGFHSADGCNLYVSNPDIECIFVREQEIADHVERGTLECGLTGHAWIVESGREVVSVAQLVCAKLNFGRTKWVLAVPEGSDCYAVEDLAGKTVNTEVVRITRDYFVRRGVPVEVEFSWGPVETHLPVLADAIVGKSDNGGFAYQSRWRVLDTVLESATELITSQRTWANQSRRKEIENLAIILDGKLHAQDRVGLMFTVRNEDLQAALGILPPGHKSNIVPLRDDKWVTVNTVIEDAASWRIMPKLKAVRAENIVEFPLNKVLL